MTSIDASCELSDVLISPLCTDRDFLLIRPRRPKVDPISWAVAHRDVVDKLILKHGALLFRGFLVEGVGCFESFADAIRPGDWTETFGESIPRSHVQQHVFTTTEYDPQLRVYVHNEGSYRTRWPLYLFFYCRVPAAHGGHTPIADCRRVYRRLPTRMIERFTEVGWLYRRNFFMGSMMTWQKTFATDSQEEVARYCQEHHMVPEWTGNGQLTVRYRRWAVLRHPRTQQTAWFNHGTVFHPYTQDPLIKQAMRGARDDEYPHSISYGDGTPIEEDTIRILDEAYAAETISFPWEVGDVLMLDNMSVAHGRSPFRGPREVFVAMKCNISCSDVADAHLYRVSTATC